MRLLLGSLPPRRRFARWLARGLGATALAGILAVLALMAWVWPRSGLEAPEPSYFVTDRSGRYLGQTGGPNGQYGYWRVDEVPPRIRQAALALEDRRFSYHPGVDPIAVVRAAWQNWQAGEVVSGASTIAMQVARLQEPAPRTLGNKILEAATATVMTLRHGREAVLRHYLRLVPYGNGSHGIAHAARHYFRKPASDLSWAEVAYLAAIPHAPSRLDPATYKGHRRAVARGRRVLERLRSRGAIDAADYALAREQIAELAVRHRRARPTKGMHAMLAVADVLRDAGAEQGMVAVTLDRRVQHLAHQALDRRLRRLRDHGARQAALMVVDRESLAVRGMVGSGGYDEEPAGKIDYTRVARSPGSALKPFVYALALEREVMRPGSVVRDSPGRAPGVRNADDRFLGGMRPRRALANSRNVPAVHLVERLGVRPMYRFLEELSLPPANGSARAYGEGMAIGSMPVRLRELISAYGVLANDGIRRGLKWLANRKPRPGRRVLAADTTRLITHFLADPMARLPSFPRMSPLEYDFPVATKTGTSHAYRDSWNVAYTRDYIVAAWVGRPDGAGMSRVSGSGGAAPLVHDVLTSLYDLAGTSDEPVSFPDPEGYVQREVCPGVASRRDCARSFTEWVAKDRRADTADGEAARWRPRGSGAVTSQLSITAPAPGAEIIRDPETPDRLQRLPLRARTDESTEQVVWYVDGEPRAVRPADEPYHWPMEPGRHRFRVGLPYHPERSPPRFVTVR